jgi:ribose transport system permease protein
MAGKPRKKRLGLGMRIFLTPEIGVLFPILIICIITTGINPVFLSRRYISSLFTGSVSMGCAALGEALVIMCGEIDLSLGYVACFSGIVAARISMILGWPLWTCILCGLATGFIIGGITGFVVTRLGISAWITTLAVQFTCLGLDQTITQGLPQTITGTGLLEFVLSRPLGLTWFFFIFVGMIVILDFIIRRTTFGYELRAVGGNREAAEMGGIDVKKIKWLVFTLAGLLAAAGGIFDALENNMAISGLGEGREFRAITACAIGGITLSGGAGSIYGAALGVILLQTVIYCFRLLGVSINIQLIMIGIILVTAVLLDMQRKRVEVRVLV